MIGVCLHSSGAVLNAPSGGPPDAPSTWDVTPGVEYVILAMGTYQRGLELLIWDDTDSPFWHPIGLFAVPAQPVPAHWEFARYDPDAEEMYGWVNCWGYPELVRNLQHNVDIQERELPALRICREEFERRRQDLDR